MEDQTIVQFIISSFGQTIQFIIVSLEQAPQRPTFKPSAPADWAKLQELQKSKETVTIQIDSLRQ